MNKLQNSNHLRACASGILLTGLALVFAAGAAAQQDEPGRYEVELIVFRHVDQRGNTPESTALLPRVYSDVMDPPVTETEDLATPLPAPAGQPTERFDRIAGDRMQLGDVYRRLQQLDAYAPILHEGWTQQARSTNEAVPNRIGRNAGGQARLAGTVTLYKQRYLHLNVDLALDSAAVSGPDGTAVFGDAATGFRTESAGQRLQESRRIRSEDLNYFDHPGLGVIITVRELAADEQEPAGG